MVNSQRIFLALAVLFYFPKQNILQTDSQYVRRVAQLGTDRGPNGEELVMNIEDALIILRLSDILKMAMKESDKSKILKEIDEENRILIVWTLV